jgi:hypothetical protein
MQVCAYLTGRYAGLRNFGKIFGLMASMIGVGRGLGPVFADTCSIRSGILSTAHRRDPGHCGRWPPSPGAWGVTDRFSVHFPRATPDVREGIACFRRGGRTDMTSSGMTGYFPNPSEVAVAPDVMGP